jgi:hypothetical protein
MNPLPPTLQAARAFSTSTRGAHAALESALDNAFDTWVKSMPDLSGLGGSFVFHEDPQNPSGEQIVLTPLSCLFILWPPRMLARGIGHLMSLGLDLGACPDVLAGMDWNTNQTNNARAARARGNDTYASTFDWAQQLAWHGRLDSLHQTRREEGRTLTVWDVLQAGLHPGGRHFSRAVGMGEVVRALVDAGVSPVGASGLLEDCLRGWVLDLDMARGLSRHLDQTMLKTLAEAHPVLARDLLALVDTCLADASAQGRPLAEETRAGLLAFQADAMALVLEDRLPETAEPGKHPSRL